MVVLPDGLVKAGGHDQVLGGMELGAHHVVVVPRQHGQAVAGLPVPDTHRLSTQSGKMFVVQHSSFSYFLTTDLKLKLGLTKDCYLFL